MVLKLYAFPQSTCSRRVAVVLHEKKVPFELIVVDRGNNQHKSAEHLQKQPFGQVPYIDDDGFFLFESRAIGRYIAAKYPDQGTKLIPTDPKANALFEQAASIETSNFDAPASIIFYERIVKPRFNQTPDEEAVQAHIKKLDAKLDAYEAILSKQKYLAGDDITLADIFHLPYALALYQSNVGNLIDSRPNLSRWYKDISSRPSWTAVKDGITSVPSFN